jgi:site-specific DNA-methyltransferase (adenine-specific)
VFGPFILDDQPRVLATAELIWDKINMSGGNTECVWGKSHERIVFGSRTHSAQNKADGYGVGTARLRRGSVLRYQRPNANGAGNHLSEKPVMLLRELIESSSRFGEIVLDPFMGSGSTLVAATIEGRRAIGIEIEERYCEIAARRMAQEPLPLGGAL